MEWAGERSHRAYPVRPQATEKKKRKEKTTQDFTGRVVENQA